MMDRRTFLATPLVFGLDELFAQEDDEAAASKEPAVGVWWPAALQRMKETDRYGIVLVVPDDPKARQAAGVVLHGMIRTASAETQALLAEAVLVCMTSALALDRVRGAKERETRFLLGPDGKRVQADDLEWPPAGREAELVRSLSTLLHGPKEERLKEHAARIEKKLPDAVRKAIDDLDAEDFAERDAASATLLKHAHGMIPYLVHRIRTEAVIERRWRLEAAVKRTFESGPEAKPGPRLPYGCSGRRGYNDPCPGCGIARAPDPSRYFLRFLTS